MSDIIPNLEDMTDAEKKAALDAIQVSIAKSKEVQKKRIGENVGLVVDALKKIESDIRSRFDEVGTAIENRVNAIKDGRDGINGQDGKNGKDGRDGKQGVQGIKGKDGRDGRDGVDGVDGVSVTSAHIDFDGSLIIGLSSGVELNVGEVLAPSLAESIKVITNGGGTSQSVIDTLASLQTQITNLIPSQTGNSGKVLTTNGTTLSWGSVAGGLSYQGTWNASTNTPTLTSSVGTNGYYYITATAGSTNLNGITDWQIGDWLMYNGTVWQKIDQSNLVTSVNGQTGAVSVGTVTSVSALTLGTTGTDLSSTVANSTTTPVITLNVPTASASNRGVLSSADWTTFNNKGSGTVTSVSGTTGRITSTGGTTPVLDLTSGVATAGTTGSASLIPVITIDTYGRVTSITTASNPQGTVTSVTGTSPVVSSGGATPAISLATAYGDTLNPYASKTANFVLAAPNGSSGAPTFRAVVAADIPTLNQNTTGTASNVTGTVAIANGGTGLTSFTASQIHYGSFSTSANLTFNGTTLTTANDASISGLTVGLGASAVATNTAVGLSVLAANTTGANNTAVGRLALGQNTTGTVNTAVGNAALYGNTSGIENSAFGGSALIANTTGNYNTALGRQSLQSNTTASNNTAVGYQSSYSLVTNSFSTTVGYQSGKTHTDGYVTAVGYNAALAATSGYSTVCAIGVNALAANTTGTNNTAVGGYNALSSNTTGGSNVAVGREALAANTTASDNTAVGYQALYNNVTGTGLTAIGKGAALANTGNYNTIVGWRTGEAITSGAGNTIVGALAGSLSTGSKNTFIGGPVIGVSNGCASAMTTGSSNTIIGNYNGNQGGLDIRTSSNYIVLSDGDGNPRQVIDSGGNLLVGTTTNSLSTKIFTNSNIGAQQTYGPMFISNEDNTDNVGRNSFTFQRGGTQVGAITTNNTNAAYGTTSDYRLKENVQPMTGALNTVSRLKPVTYKWKSTGTDSQGFLAHELQEIVSDCVTGEKDAVDEDGKPIYQNVDTSFLVATLTAAIQELKAINDTQAETINALTARIVALESK
jgi:hypothetical protein